MSYIQTRGFDTSKAGTTLYLCLGNVQKGYSIPGKYRSAWVAWQNTVQHRDALPQGVAVPVFWSLTLTLDGVTENYGHVAVSLPDGRIWTDGKYYANLDTLNRYYLGGRGQYVGWGETLNDVRVVQGGNNMIDDGDTDFLRIGHSEVGGWNFQDAHSGSSDALFHAAWNGKDKEEFIMQQWKNGEAWRNERNKEMAEYPGLVKKVDELNRVVTVKDNALTEANKQIESLKAQVGDNSKWETFKALVRELVGK